MLPKIGKKCNSKIRIIETQKYLEFLHGSIEEDACSEKKGKKICCNIKVDSKMSKDALSQKNTTESEIHCS